MTLSPQDTVNPSTSRHRSSGSLALNRLERPFPRRDAAGDLGGGHSFAEQEALPVFAAGVAQRLELFGRLHALGDDVERQAGAELGDGLDDRLSTPVGFQASGAE